MMMAVRDRAISMGAVLEDDNDGNGDRQSDQPENCCARRGGVGQRWLMRRALRRQDGQMGGDHWSLTKISKPSWKLGKLAPIDQIPEKNLQMNPREVKRLHMSP